MTIYSYVDGIVDHAIIGWIVNPDVTDEGEKVICHGINGPSLAFLPFVHRNDVCAAHGIEGRFGFAIPLAALRSFGGVVHLKDRFGFALGGASTLELPPDIQPFDDRSPVQILLHIQKTAGTSVRAAFEHEFPVAGTAFLYPYGSSGISLEKLASMPFHQRRGFTHLMGHIHFGTGYLIPRRSEYFAILRNTMSRLTSHYNHHIAAGTKFTIDGTLQSTETVLEECLTDEFDNLTTRIIAGVGVSDVAIGQICEDHVELALQNIRTMFRFVGLIERLDRDFPILCEIMGISPRPLEFLNRPEATKENKQGRAINWNNVMHRNRFDQMLYSRVLAEGLDGRDLDIPRAMKSL